MIPAFVAPAHYSQRAWRGLIFLQKGCRAGFVLSNKEAFLEGQMSFFQEINLYYCTVGSKLSSFSPLNNKG